MRRMHAATFAFLIDVFGLDNTPARKQPTIRNPWTSTPAAPPPKAKGYLRPKLTPERLRKLNVVMRRPAKVA